MDFFSIEETFDCTEFKKQLDDATSNCQLNLIWVRGMGLYPLKYQTLPMQPSSNLEIKLPKEYVFDAIYQNFPHVDVEKTELVFYGDIENELT
ncbi:hypothetical protein [Vibrio sp. 10N.239.312.D08]|uniref:hypothetical protein n=1 Tax=Vibrio sp. 10N.239.312.D08 TaxID=3229978 RepID=UPI00355381AB